MFVKVRDMRIVNKAGIAAEFALDLYSDKAVKPFLTLYKIKMMEPAQSSQNGQRWLSGPAEKFVNREGETKYKRLVDMPSEAFRDDVLHEAIDEYNRIGGAPSAPAQEPLPQTQAASSPDDDDIPF
jgi:hypothetical protein